VRDHDLASIPARPFNYRSFIRADSAAVAMAEQETSTNAIKVNQVPHRRNESLFDAWDSVECSFLLFVITRPDLQTPLTEAAKLTFPEKPNTINLYRIAVSHRGSMRLRKSYHAFLFKCFH
jgi:hypothetical protein